MRLKDAAVAVATIIVAAAVALTPELVNLTWAFFNM